MRPEVFDTFGMLGIGLAAGFILGSLATVLWLNSLTNEVPSILLSVQEPTMREITTHKVNECNDGIKITAVDEPGSGGANHHYRMEFNDPKWGPDPSSMRQVNELYFQNGPIGEVGVNGITHEALLAIVTDRLEGFQRGPFACEDNREALAHLGAAREALLRRTRGRVERGVEGTHVV